MISHVPSQSFDGVISFSEWCRTSGTVPGQRTRLLAKIPSDSPMATARDIPVPSPIAFIKRLRLMDKIPTLVERLRYRMEFDRHLLDFDPDSDSIYQRLMDKGVDIHWATRAIDAVAADETDAELPGWPRERRCCGSVATPSPGRVSPSSSPATDTFHTGRVSPFLPCAGMIPR